MSTIQKYWRKQAKIRDTKSFVVIDAVVCADGFSMSVQASAGHYSQPRWKTLKTGRYTCWEVMPLARPLPKSLTKFANSASEKYEVGCVCGFVPTHIVDAIIDRHGGLKGE